MTTSEKKGNLKYLKQILKILFFYRNVVPIISRLYLAALESHFGNRGNAKFYWIWNFDVMHVRQRDESLPKLSDIERLTRLVYLEASVTVCLFGDLVANDELWLRVGQCTPVFLWNWNPDFSHAVRQRIKSVRALHSPHQSAKEVSILSESRSYLAKNI